MPLPLYLFRIVAFAAHRRGQKNSRNAEADEPPPRFFRSPASATGKKRTYNAKPPVDFGRITTPPQRLPLRGHFFDQWFQLAALMVLVYLIDDFGLPHQRLWLGTSMFLVEHIDDFSFSDQWFWLSTLMGLFATSMVLAEHIDGFGLSHQWFRLSALMILACQINGFG